MIYFNSNIVSRFKSGSAAEGVTGEGQWLFNRTRDLNKRDLIEMHKAPKGKSKNPCKKFAVLWNINVECGC